MEKEWQPGWPAPRALAWALVLVSAEEWALAWRENLTRPEVRRELEQGKEELQAKRRRPHRAEAMPVCFRAMNQSERRKRMEWLRGRMQG